MHRYRYVLCENVVEFGLDWELFDWWVEGMTRLGYTAQTVCVSSAHIGGAGNAHAPQWRDRLYLVYTRKGMPVPDVAPRPRALCVECGHDVDAVQSWKDPRKPRLGKYRTQYVYRCPNTACRHAVVEPYILPAAAAIDWTNLGKRIGDRKRPLAASTMRRIRAGLEMFATPAVVRACGTDPDGSSYLRAWPADGEPLGTRVTSGVDGLACPPMLVPCGGTWNTTASTVDTPMRTRTVRDMEAVVTPFYVKNYGGFCTPEQNVRPVTEPVATVTANDHTSIVTPGSFLAVLRNNATARSVYDPMATIAAGGTHHGLVVPYYRTGKATRSDDPFSTVTTRDRHALVTADAVDVEDCHFRMIQPRESLRAQRFPDSYLVKGNNGEQTMQAGNAVSANVAQWLGERVAAAIAA